MFDLANGYCCGGTLGSLIETADGKFHILSNFHVLAADVDAGDNQMYAMPGQPVIHPALIDVSCNASRAEEVATLSLFGDPLNPLTSSAIIDAASRGSKGPS